MWEILCSEAKSVDKRLIESDYTTRVRLQKRARAASGDSGL
jgi:hypothetical protein